MVYGLLIYLYVVVHSCITYIFGVYVVRTLIGVLFHVQLTSFMQNVDIYNFTVYPSRFFFCWFSTDHFFYKALKFVYGYVELW